jgi:integrase/recombinase XerD
MISDVMRDYLNSPHVRKLEASTQREYCQELEVFAQWCAAHALTHDRHKGNRAVPIHGTDLEPIALHQVNDMVVHCFLDHLRATHKPRKAKDMELSTNTLAGYVRVIKSFLNWCVDDPQYTSYVQSVVVQRIEKPHIEEKITETFTPEQMNALFNASMQEESEHLQVRDRAILALLFDTGIRAAELITLTIGNVWLNTKEPHIRVHGKRNKWREINIGEQTRRALSKYITTFREPTIDYAWEQQEHNFSPTMAHQKKKQHMEQALVFVNRYGEQLTVSGLDQLLERLGMWAGIEGVECRPHVARHTFSANFMRQNNDIYRLSGILDHSSVATTERYLKSIRQAEARRGVKSVLDNL